MTARKTSSRPGWTRPRKGSKRPQETVISSKPSRVRITFEFFPLGVKQRKVTFSTSELSIMDSRLVEEIEQLLVRLFLKKDVVRSVNSLRNLRLTLSTR